MTDVKPSTWLSRFGRPPPPEPPHVEEPQPVETLETQPILEVEGWCPYCEQATTFKAYDLWFRDYFICGLCASLPRQRALVAVLNQVFPAWRDAEMHESSPALDGAKFRRECAAYTPTQYDTAIAFGAISPDGGYRSEDLEAQTFADESFDIVITQDVFEHLFRPDLAIAEIARTLKPGGVHICTIPLIRGSHPSRRRARRAEDDEIIYLETPEYHHNPIDLQGSLVTIDWGFDVADYFDRHGGLNTTIVQIDDLSRGIRAALNDVLVCRKSRSPDL